MLNRLILKVTNFQLPPPKHLGTLAIMPPSMSNRVNDLKGKKKYWFWGLHVKQGEKQLKDNILITDFFCETVPHVDDMLIHP